MTRRSKRELERALEAFDDATPTNDRPSLDEMYPGPVTTFIQCVARDLHRIRHQNPETIVNAPGPDATERFLVIVRDHYGIDEDRDDDVRQTLEESVAGQEYHRPVDKFATAPVSVAAQFDLETPAGETLTELVHTDREDEATQLLVHTVYDALAADGLHMEGQT